jgi:predicted small metal-binding protein
MTKVLRCRDVGLDCNFEARAETSEELLRKAADHGKAVHGIKEGTPELVAKMKQAVREE